MADSTEEEFHDFYKYTPSLPAAATFIALFTITTSLHVHQLVRHRAWAMIPLAIGGSFEVVGYVGRIWSHTEAPLFTDTPYIIQSLFLLLGPALIAASIYMVLGRIALLLKAEHHLLVRRSWMTKIFVTGDIVSFIVQGAGGGIMASGDGSNMSLGENILIVGLAIQIVFLMGFIIVSLLFKIRLRRHPIQPLVSADLTNFRWERHLAAICVASSLVMARSIFRFVEYIQGSHGELLKREIFLYSFDAALILATMVLLNIQQPGVISSLLRGPSKRSDPTLVNPSSVALRRLGSNCASGSDEECGFAISAVEACARHTYAARGIA